MNAVEFSSHRHPLNVKELSPEETRESRVCGLCGETAKGSGYECSQCDFVAHVGCAENPPSPVIEVSKTHEHTLTLLPREVSFICNACGLKGDKSAYVCLKCSFMIHKDCIGLPLVLRINRHDHRITRTFFLGPGEWTCRVCRRSIEGRYGAYSCQTCEDYAVHTICAVRKNVWDGKELIGVPEEEEEVEFDEEFSVIDDSLILHFAHNQHNLRRQDEYTDNVCSGCALPIASETYFRCGECDFFLHVRCANLPRKIDTFLHVHRLTLCPRERSDTNSLSRCDACQLHFNGFSYRCLECKDDTIEFDVRCSSVFETWEVYGHKHPLLLDDVPTDEIDKAKICSGCGLKGLKSMLSCRDCSLYLCVPCAALPDVAKYKYDEHLLSIHTGLEDVTGKYLCDICEKKIEEKGNYYKCFDCGPVLHTNCAVGSFRHMRPGLSFISHGHEYQVVLNDRTSQLRCSQCLHDCNEPLLLMSTTTAHDSVYLCSSPCFTAFDVSVQLSLL